jgi:hypothetical protein
MERMLVDLICANRLAVYHALQLAAQPASCASIRAQRSRCAEIEQRRFVQSVRTLATLRELMPRGLAPLDSVKLHQPEVKTREKA